MPIPKLDLERLLPVLVHIQSHLNDDLSLTTVAPKAYLSPSRFHRVFRATIGETLMRYVSRVRLDRAAFRLRTCSDSVLRIALEVGYSSHETFTRSFVRQFGVPPLKYRQCSPSRSKPNDALTPLELDRNEGVALSRVRFLEFCDIPMAFVRHVGPYEKIDRRVWDELIVFARRRGLGKDTVRWGIVHDAPGITQPQRMRFDAAIQVAEPFQASGRIGCQRLRPGIYAVTTHVGPYSTLERAYRALFRQVTRQKRYRMVGLPAVEILHQSRIDASHVLPHTDVCLPVERT